MYIELDQLAFRVIIKNQSLFILDWTGVHLCRFGVTLIYERHISDAKMSKVTTLTLLKVSRLLCLALGLCDIGQLKVLRQSEGASASYHCSSTNSSHSIITSWSGRCHFAVAHVLLRFVTSFSMTALFQSLLKGSGVLGPSTSGSSGANPG